MKALATRAGVALDELLARHAAGEKWCYRCREWRMRTEFVRDRSRYDGLASVCCVCRTKERIAPGPSIRDRRVHAAIGEAWCRGCAAWLPIAAVRGGACAAHHAAAERARYARGGDYQRSRRHRSAQRKRGVAPVPPIAQEHLLDLFDGECAYCNQPATTFDHIVPVSRGGQTEPRNLVPACVSCNSSKRDRDLDEWFMTTPHPIKEQLANILVMQHCWPV